MNFPGGPGREEGRRAGADRSAHLSGGARPGGGEEGAGRGAACQRAARSRALPKLVANNYTSAQQADTAKRAGGAADEALVQQDQAQIDTARTQLSYTTIISPIDGRTGMRQVDAGNIVHASDTTGLVVITQLQPISVLFTLPQQTLRAGGQGDAARAPPRCWPTRKARRAARPACWIPARWRCWTTRSIRPPARSS